MKSKNYDPFLKMIELATETQEVVVDEKIVRCAVCDVDQQITIAKEIASFIAPKLKGIELKAEVDAEFTFKVQQFAEISAGDKMLSRPAEAARELLVDEETRRRAGEITKNALGSSLQIIEQEITSDE